MILQKTAKTPLGFTLITALSSLIELFVATSFRGKSVSLALMEGEGFLLEYTHDMFCINNLNKGSGLASLVAK